jgi:hypothetical protein
VLLVFLGPLSLQLAALLGPRLVGRPLLTPSSFVAAFAAAAAALAIPVLVLARDSFSAPRGTFALYAVVISQVSVIPCSAGSLGYAVKMKSGRNDGSEVAKGREVGSVVGFFNLRQTTLPGHELCSIEP